jgi:hypothetical protein
LNVLLWRALHGVLHFCQHEQQHLRVLAAGVMA